MDDCLVIKAKEKCQCSMCKATREADKFYQRAMADILVVNTLKQLKANGEIEIKGDKIKWIGRNKNDER